MRELAAVLWPSFVVAVVGELIFFTVIDPAELYFLGAQVEVGPLATYSIGFLLFWALAAVSSSFTAFLLRTAGDINGDSGARR
jgi:hypothetical protein